MLKREVVRRTGLSAPTILRLEQRGLIRPTRDWNGWRRYSEDDVKRIEAALRGEIAVDPLRPTLREKT